jgi:hypothetical protein
MRGFPEAGHGKSAYNPLPPIMYMPSDLSRFLRPASPQSSPAAADPSRARAGQPGQRAGAYSSVPYGQARTVTLSPSTIGLFLECPRCFWLEKMKGISRPRGIFPSLPGGMDRLLKEHFDRHRADGSEPPEIQGIPGALFPDLERLREWRDNRRGLRWTDPRSGFGLMGALDDLFVTAEGLYAPLDFKTRGSPRRDNTHSYYQHQMDLYSLLLERNGLPTAGFAVLIFYHPVSVSTANGRHDVLFEPDPVKLPTSIERGEAAFRRAVECLLESEPGPSSGCEWCGWADIAGKA